MACKRLEAEDSGRAGRGAERAGKSPIGVSEGWSRTKDVLGGSSLEGKSREELSREPPPW